MFGSVESQKFRPSISRAPLCTMPSSLHICAWLTNYGITADDYRHPNEVTATLAKASECPLPLWPANMTREMRKRKPAMRARYSVWIWGEQLAHGNPVTPACTWCGLPTGYWCDGCELAGVKPMRAICNRCEAEEKYCKPCIRGHAGWVNYRSALIHVILLCFEDHTIEVAYAVSNRRTETL